MNKDRKSYLKEDKFNSDEIIEELKYKLSYVVGKPVMRMAGVELNSFLEIEVKNALHNVFAKCEALYINDIARQADQSSKTLLEGILAGAEMGRREN